MSNIEVIKYSPHDNEKIINLERAIEIIENTKLDGKKTIYTSGGFDLIHTGHIRYLEVAKMHADYLIVGVESDESMKLTRGKEPINTLRERLEVLATLEHVDYVFGFNDVIKSYDDPDALRTFEKRYKILKPTYVAMPLDNMGTPQIDQIEAAGCKPVVIDTPAVDGKTSSKIAKLL